jgi:hypothetical protein
MAVESTHKRFSVPDRGISERTIGFSPWLEYVLAGGLGALFLAGVLVNGYLEMVFNAQVYAVLLLLAAAVAATSLVLKTGEGAAGKMVRVLLGVMALGTVALAAIQFIPRSITQIGSPPLWVRLIVYVALLCMAFWAWGFWLWIYGQVWLHRAVPSPLDGQTGRERSMSRQALDDLRAEWRAAGSEDGWWRVWGFACVGFSAVREAVAGRIALSVLDPLFLFPEVEGRKRLERLFEVTGHRVIDPENHVRGAEYDKRRLAAYKSVLVGAFLLLLAAGLFEIKLPRRETPKGVLGGTGKRIARGRVPVQKKRKKERKREKREKRKEQDKVRRDSVLKIFQQEMLQTQEQLEYSEASVTADAGLPSGQGSGATAAGSPKGTKVGGTYYMFRVKHSGNWDANRRGIPALMREFTKAWNVKTNRFDQPVELSNLRRHSGKYFPVLLYITGNGQVGAGRTDIENLRWYLENGGFLFADSSGGDFYHQFRRLMRRVLPGERMRKITYDHTIFRGRYMPWRLASGCPIYRRHPGPGDAQGIFLGDRLAVFYSPGDLGAAWATVGWGQKRREVEMAFRMGVNIITYAMLYGGQEEQNQGR